MRRIRIVLFLDFYWSFLIAMDLVAKKAMDLVVKKAMDLVAKKSKLELSLSLQNYKFKNIITNFFYEGIHGFESRKGFQIF